MQEELYEDAIIDVVTPEGLMTRSCAIKVRGPRCPL